MSLVLYLMAILFWVKRSWNCYPLKCNDLRQNIFYVLQNTMDMKYRITIYQRFLQAVMSSLESSIDVAKRV